jgi:hypothetical protein
MSKTISISDLTDTEKAIITSMRSHHQALAGENDQIVADERITLEFLEKPPGYQPSPKEAAAVKRAALAAYRREGFSV